MLVVFICIKSVMNILNSLFKIGDKDHQHISSSTSVSNTYLPLQYHPWNLEKKSSMFLNSVFYEELDY